jgi:hypothetical protein
LRQEGEVIERVLLASDDPGAWTAAVAAGCPFVVAREPGFKV